MSVRSFQRVIAELVLLAMLVGFIPELAFGALKDSFGPCGFDAKTCQGLYIQGIIQAFLAVLCILASVLIAFVVSDDFSGGDGHE